MEGGDSSLLQHPDSAPARAGSRHCPQIQAGFSCRLRCRIVPGCPQSHPRVPFPQPCLGLGSVRQLLAPAAMCLSLSCALGKPLLPRVPPRAGRGTRF